MKHTSIATIVVFVSLITGSVFGQFTQIVTNDKKIIGSNTMKPVDANMVGLPFKYREVAEAVGMMSMGCTGTHIGNGLVVSAGHCFDAAKIAKYRTGCEGVQVFWGVRHGKSPSGVSNCRQILVLETNNQKDYALFKVDVAPKAALKIKTQGRPSFGTRVTIFSHPGRQPLMWSGTCEISRAVGYGFSAQLIHHSCDTNPGSSGAAIVDVNSNEIVGIHDGGYKPEGRTGTNYGTYIDYTYIPSVLQRLGYR